MEAMQRPANETVGRLELLQDVVRICVEYGMLVQHQSHKALSTQLNLRAVLVAQRGQAALNLPMILDLLRKLNGNLSALNLQTIDGAAKGAIAAVSEHSSLEKVVAKIEATLTDTSTAKIEKAKLEESGSALRTGSGDPIAAMQAALQKSIRDKQADLTARDAELADLAAQKAGLVNEIQTVNEDIKGVEQQRDGMMRDIFRHTNALNELRQLDSLNGKDKERRLAGLVAHKEQMTRDKDEAQARTATLKEETAAHVEASKKRKREIEDSAEPAVSEARASQQAECDGAVDVFTARGKRVLQELDKDMELLDGVPCAPVEKASTASGDGAGEAGAGSSSGAAAVASTSAGVHATMAEDALEDDSAAGAAGAGASAAEAPATLAFGASLPVGHEYGYAAGQGQPEGHGGAGSAAAQASDDYVSGAQGQQQLDSGGTQGEDADAMVGW